MAPFKNAVNSYKETISRTEKSQTIFSQLDSVLQNIAFNSVIYNSTRFLVLFGITGKFANVYFNVLQVVGKCKNPAFSRISSRPSQVFFSKEDLPRIYMGLQESQNYF